MAGIIPSTQINTNSSPISRWFFIDEAGNTHDLYEAYFQVEENGSLRNILVYQKSVDLYLPDLHGALPSSGSRVSLEDFILNSGYASYTVINIYNNYIQPTITTGDLTNWSVKLINNGEIRGTYPGEPALVVTSPLTLENNGKILGAGGNGGRGGGASSEKIITAAPIGVGWESRDGHICEPGAPTFRWWRVNWLGSREGRWHEWNNCQNAKYVWDTITDTVPFGGLNNVFVANRADYNGCEVFGPRFDYPRDTTTYANPGCHLRVNNGGVWYKAKVYPGGAGGLGQCYVRPGGPTPGESGTSGSIKKYVKFTFDDEWYESPSCDPNAEMNYPISSGKPSYLGGYFDCRTGNVFSYVPCGKENTDFRSGNGGSGGTWGQPGEDGEMGGLKNREVYPELGGLAGPAILGANNLKEGSVLGETLGPLKEIRSGG